MTLYLDKTEKPYQEWLDESVDCDMAGNPISRRQTMQPHDIAVGAIPFCAGYQAAQRAAPQVEAAPVDDQAAFKAYLQECDDNAINPDVAGAFHAAWLTCSAIAQAAPVMDAQPVAPTNEELQVLWDTTHQGHPVDFAANVLELWGGWPAGLLGHGGSLSAAAQPVEVQPMDAEHWKELYALREAVKGPEGFATWQDAAVAERVRRVKLEAKVKEAQRAPLTATEVNRLRQLVNVVEDINPNYMQPEDWAISAKLASACGMRVSDHVAEAAHGIQPTGEKGDAAC